MGDGQKGYVYYFGADKRDMTVNIFRVVFEIKRRPSSVQKSWWRPPFFIRVELYPFLSLVPLFMARNRQAFCEPPHWCLLTTYATIVCRPLDSCPSYILAEARQNSKRKQLPHTQTWIWTSVGELTLWLCVGYKALWRRLLITKFEFEL